VLDVPGLAAARAAVLSRGRRRLGRLDEVRGRWFGGGRGVLAGGRELRLDLGQGGLESSDGRRQRLDLRLQPLAIGTRRVASTPMPAYSTPSRINGTTP